MLLRAAIGSWSGTPKRSERCAPPLRTRFSARGPSSTRQPHTAALYHDGSGRGSSSGSSGSGNSLMAWLSASASLMPQSAPQPPALMPPDQVVERTRALLDLTLEQAVRQMNAMVDQAQQSSSDDGTEVRPSVAATATGIPATTSLSAPGASMLGKVQAYAQRTAQELRRISDESMLLLGEGGHSDMIGHDLQHHLNSMDPAGDAERERAFWQVQRYLEEAIADLRHAVSLARHRLVALAPGQHVTESAAVQELRYMTEEAIQEVRQAAAAVRAAQKHELGSTVRSLTWQVVLQLSAGQGQGLTTEMQQTLDAALLDLQISSNAAGHALSRHLDRTEQHVVSCIKATADKGVADIRQAPAISGSSSDRFQARLDEGVESVRSATIAAVQAVMEAKKFGQQSADSADASARKTTASAIAELRRLQQKAQQQREKALQPSSWGPWMMENILYGFVVSLCATILLLMPASLVIDRFV